MGIIQSADITLEGATAQLTASTMGPITVPAPTTPVTLASGTLTTIGQLVQIAYNTQISNPSSSPVTVNFSVTFQSGGGPTHLIDAPTITVQPGQTATLAKQATYAPPAGSGNFAFEAFLNSGGSPLPTASYSDMSVTELRR